MSIDRRSLLVSSAAVFGAAAAPTMAEGPAAGPPVAPVQPVTETLFGTAVTDPYRWMEAEGAEWKAYVEGQGAYARRVLDNIPGRADLYAAVRRYRTAAPSVSNFQIGGDHIFSEVLPVGAETSKLYVRKGIARADRLLIDPNVYAPSGSHASLDWWAASPDGSHVVFGTSPGGSENSTARVIETESGAFLPEVIDRTEDAGPNWAPDGSGFFYNRLQPGASPDNPDKFKLSACWFHRLNTDPSADLKVLAKGSSPEVQMADVDSPSVGAAPGSNVAIGRVSSGTQHEGALYACSLSAAGAGRPDWRPICTPVDEVTGVQVHGDDVYLLTHKDAQRYKITRTTAARPASQAVTVVPESASVIRTFAAARDALYIQDLNAGLGGLRRMAFDTGAVTQVALPFKGSVSDLYADTLHDGAWVRLGGWVRPPVFCRVGPDGAVVQTDIQPKLAIDVSPYVAEETFATARDGVRVPLSIVCRRGLARDGRAPLLMDAYGAYGATTDPGLVAGWLPLLDLGGVLAIAHVRGGGELGEDWHLAGKKLTKPNTWRDTIDCARHLIADGYTSSRKLGIMGGSAGGITVGRFMTEEPQLAAVIIDQVGVSNTLRTEFSASGAENIPEFGTVTDPEGFKGLYAMDAYQHIRNGTAYPSVLLTTGLNDPRCPPWEPTKMTARLQAATSSKNPVLLRVGTDDGHGIGSTRSQRDVETADIIAFLLWRTGDPRFQPKADALR